MILALLPPSSNVVGTIRSAPAFATPQPTSVDPVNDNLFTPS